MVEKTFKVIDPLGIHARSATTLVQTANKFVSEINIELENKVVNLKSIMGVMSLGLEQNAIFKLSVSGRDEEEALQKLISRFHNERLAE